MSDFKMGGVPTPDYDADDINFVSQKSEFTEDVFIYSDVFVYGKLYADIDLVNVSVTGITTFSGDIQFHGTNGTSSITFDESQDSLEFKDEAKATFGDGRDLQIYHTQELKDQTDSNGDSVCDNRTSLIKENGSGGLIFKSNGGDGPGAYQFFDQGWRPLLKMHGGNNARTVLYHGGDERLVTTSSGVTVSGGQVIYTPITQTERDALTAVAGSVIYNSTTNKLQCYNGSSWNDLF